MCARRYWKTGEITVALSMMKDGLSDQQIANKLNRPMLSVRSFRARRRKTHNEPFLRRQAGKFPWTDELDLSLMHLAITGVKYRDICTIFGLAHRTIQERISNLGLANLIQSMWGAKKRRAAFSRYLDRTQQEYGVRSPRATDILDQRISSDRQWKRCENQTQVRVCELMLESGAFDNEIDSAKFVADAAEKLSLSQHSIRRALAKLTKLGVITRRKGHRLHNGCKGKAHFFWMKLAYVRDPGASEWSRNKRKRERDAMTSDRPHRAVFD